MADPENGNGSSLGPRGYRERLVDESFRQGPVFIILLLLIAMIGYIGHYSITIAVPAHLESIKSGYKEVGGQMEKSVERLAVAWEKDSSRDESQSKSILTKLDDIKDAVRANHIKAPAAKSVVDSP